MKRIIIALLACSILATPALARGRTGRGADADGDRIRLLERNQLQGEQGTAAILVLRALIEQLVRDGVLPRESALMILDRAKPMSAAETPTGQLRSRQLRELDAIRDSLTPSQVRHYPGKPSEAETSSRYGRGGAPVVQ